MKKISYLFALICIVTSSCKVVMKVPLTTDGLPVFGDSVLIQRSLSVKQQTYLFQHLKPSRKKYVDSINQLNDQVFKMFQDNKISAAKFNVYANASRAICQIFYWLINTPANTTANHPVSLSVSALTPAASSNQLLAGSNEKLMAIERTINNSPAVPANDAFEQVAHQIIAYLQELISHL